MARWQKGGELSPEGERLASDYQQGIRGGELEKKYGQNASSLERRARGLIASFGLKETKEQIEALELAHEIIRPPRILHFDIETTGFDPTYGVILMMGYGRHDEEATHMVSITDPDIARKSKSLKPFEKDKYLLERIRTVLEDPEIDVLSGHYSKQGKFDVPFINTRLLFHGMQPLREKDHIDSQQIFAGIRGKTDASSSLKNSSGFLLPIEEQKDQVPKIVWYNAQHGDPDALQMIADYCEQDVKAQRALLKKIMPFARATDVPNGQILGDRVEASCISPTCEKPNEVEKVGWKITKAGMKYPRYVCKHCGKNMRGRRSVTDIHLRRFAD